MRVLSLLLLLFLGGAALGARVSKPRVHERWRCTGCGAIQVKPYRTLPWTRRRGRELPCATCTGGAEPWTKHEYIGDAEGVRA